MVQMLIRQDRPLLRRKPPKEAMRMSRASGWPCLAKPLNQAAQPLPLQVKVPIVSHDQVLRGRRIPAYRLVIFKHHRLHNCPKYPSHKHPRRNPVPQGPLHTCRTVGHGLRGTHFAPHPLAVRPQPRDPLLHFFRGRRFKEVLHTRSKLLQPCPRHAGKRPATPGCRQSRQSPMQRAFQSLPYR